LKRLKNIFEVKSSPFILFLLLKDGPVGLGRLTDWTFCCLLDPLGDAFLVVGVLAFELDELFILLKLAIADCAEILLVLSFVDVVSIVVHSLQALYFLFCEALFFGSLPGHHHV
jgi:hypothetical protein